jgi:hypothetical protein
MSGPHTPQRRALAGLAMGALGAVGLVAAAGLYTEAIRVPDQP